MTTVPPSIYHPLELIGFNRTQAEVYLTVLELCPSSIWDIAKKSGIKRPTCYAVLDELVARGFASKIDDGRRLLYSVSSPKEPLARLEQQRLEFASQVAALEGIGSHSAKKPSIRLYEGLEGIKQVYASMLT